jgi:hypothetical protein
MYPKSAGQFLIPTPPSIHPLTALKGPRYIVAMSVNCAMTFIAICAALTLRIMLVRLNKKLDRGEAVDGAVNEGTAEAGRKGFRYKV